MIAQLKVQLPSTATTDPVAAAADAYFLTFYATSFSSQFKVHLADKGGAKFVVQWLIKNDLKKVQIFPYELSVHGLNRPLLSCDVTLILSAKFCEQGDG